jgi:hypothetical protein
MIMKLKKNSPFAKKGSEVRAIGNELYVKDYRGIERWIGYVGDDTSKWIEVIYTEAEMKYIREHIEKCKILKIEDTTTLDDILRKTLDYMELYLREMLNEKTKADLISFGNYLLSDERDKLTSDTNKKTVTEADLSNWQDSREEIDEKK